MGAAGHALVRGADEEEARPRRVVVIQEDVLRKINGLVAAQAHVSSSAGSGRGTSGVPSTPAGPGDMGSGHLEPVAADIEPDQQL